MSYPRRMIQAGAVALCLVGSPLVGSSTAQMTAPRTPRTDTTVDDRRDWGWLGLLGLVGLAGLVRNRREDRFGTRSATATR